MQLVRKQHQHQHRNNQKKQTNVKESCQTLNQLLVVYLVLLLLFSFSRQQHQIMIERLAYFVLKEVTFSVLKTYNDCFSNFHMFIFYIVRCQSYTILVINILTIRYFIQDKQMIRKSQYPHFTSKNPYIETNQDEKTDIIVRKKLFDYAQNNRSLKSKLSLQSNPLRQVSNILSYKNIQPSQQRIQKHLKSQTSLNDLSEIVAIDMSCSGKKENSFYCDRIQRGGKTSNVSPNKLCKRDAEFSYKAKNHQKNVIDDFQILDIYATTMIQVKQASCQKQDQSKSRRKSGGIRRNSRCQVKQRDNIENQNSKTLELTRKQQPQKIIILEPYDKTNSSLNHRQISHYQHDSKPVSSNLNNPIKECGQILFQAISQKRKKLSQYDLQRFPLSCEIKLLLGPILTKFRQKKYFELDINQFQREFSLIMTDFSIKERLQLVDKIQDGRFRNSESYQHSRVDPTPMQQQRNHLANSILIECQDKGRPREGEREWERKREEEVEIIRVGQGGRMKERGNTQDRLNFLTSKVDQYLSRISEHQIESDQNPRKQKVSTLMSRLSQIQQISGDSEDLMSKGDSRQTELSDISLSKNVYVDNACYPEESYRDSYRPILRESEPIEAETTYKIISKGKYEDFEGYNQDIDKGFGNQYESKTIKRTNHRTPLQSVSYICSRRGSSLQHSRSIQSRETRVNRIYESRLFPSPDHSSDHQSTNAVSLVSLRGINLEFSQLSKYLY